MCIVCNGDQRNQHNTRNYTQWNNSNGNRFYNTAKRHYESGPGQCGGTDKEHGSIADQQEICAVLQ
jgi:hypothetical protein